MSKISISDVLIYGLIFLIFFFLSGVIVSHVVLKGETVFVPDIEGKTVAEAQAILEKKDLSLARKGSEANDQWERGRIIRQNPAAGSKIRISHVIGVTVSAGSRQIAVPALEGKSLETAVVLLKESGLYKGRITHIHTPRFAAGKIISQRPEAGVMVERNSAVGFLVGQGDWEERYVMPDLIGRRYDAVMNGLARMDFKVGDIRYAYYPGLEKGVIIKQSPPNGYKIQKRNLITLEVSR